MKTPTPESRHQRKNEFLDLLSLNAFADEGALVDSDLKQPLAYVEADFCHHVSPELVERVALWFRLQNLSNRVMAGKNWIHRELPYWLANTTEATEAQGHLGWEWWKPAKIDRDQAFLEVVDILHFSLSSFLINVKEGVHAGFSHYRENLVVKVEKSEAHIPATDSHKVAYDFNFTGVANYWLACIFDSDLGKTLLNQVPPVLDALGQFQLFTVAGQEVIPASFFQMALSATFVGKAPDEHCATDQECIETLNLLDYFYMRKNVLNMFRQRHGEKDKNTILVPYTRQWHVREDLTKEDNEVLAALCKKYNHGEFDPEVLWKDLSREYRRHLVRAQIVVPEGKKLLPEDMTLAEWMATHS